jgi:uncharacterized protein YjiS (DUF1127 family)
MTSIDHDSMPLVGTERHPRFALVKPIGNFSNHLLSQIGSLFGALRKRRSRKRSLQQLSQLDEHMLRDIGLNPQDFHDAFENRRSSLLFTPFRTPYDRN